MLVLLDVGNTRSKYVCITNKNRSTVNYIENNQLNEAWLSQTFEHADRIFLANVNNEQFTEVIKGWAKRKAITFKQLQTQQQQFELQCAYQAPSKLGIDRWLVMLAASQLFPKKACLVIDAGTATTIDAISPLSQHLGGWILPGIDMLYHSLINNTQKIIADKSVQPSLALGKNTSECVNNGAWAATVGAIELQFQQLKTQFDEIEIVITGGNGCKLSSQLAYPHHIFDDLVFIGMQRFS
ncbi:type III pantothenate kinase [Thalassotalea piscium]|uniref:Type III pantothenate kinase n=1 Tax=Thalassotalea piscium TaxID=1230533 RepID=A0A7X0NG98_9GAMM|nr:type III pantothenate kinase [Thalassotalea piscium]MBB6542921.1 type III pantothenate kinase [Thalassotalea piscium]